MRRGTVLVVENDADVRDRYAAWLEDAGYEVTMCPGPDAPDYTCIGARGGTCPLAEEADVVVLDMHLASDEVMVGSPAWHVLCYYVDHDKGVVALSTDRDFVHPLADENVTVLERPADRQPLLDAVRGFAG